MDVSLRKKLDDIFYGQNIMMRGFDVFKDMVKGVSEDKLRFYYDNQEVVQMFQPIVVKHDRHYIPITTSAPFKRVYFDTMFLTSLNLTFVNAVDLFSKYGFSAIFRGKVINSDKTTQVLDEVVRQVVDLGYYISDIRADDGSEFKGSFKKECKDLLIDLKYTDPNDKLQTSPIEALNRTIRLSLEKFIAVLSNEHPKMVQVEKAMSDIMNSYNHTKHSSTNYSPIEILRSKDIQTDVFLKQELKKLDILDNDNDRIPVGSWVRIATTPSAFNKLKPTFSKELYQIERFDENRHRYILKGLDKYYESWQLQIVNKKNLMTHTMKRYVDLNKADDTRLPRSQEKELRTLKDYTTASDKYKKSEEISGRRTLKPNPKYI